MKRFSLKTRVALAVSLLFVVFATMMAAYLLSVAERDYRRTFARQQETLLAALSGSIDDKLQIIQQMLLSEVTTLTPGIINNAEAAQKFLDHKQSLHSAFDNGLYLLSSTGRVIAESPYIPGRRNRDVSFRDFFKKTVASGRPVISSPYISTHTPDHPAIIMTVPIKSPEGRLQAVLAGSLDLLGKNFLEDIARIRIGNRGVVSLLDSDGSIIVHPDRSLLLKQWGGKKSDMLRKVQGNEHGVAELLNERGQEVVVSYRRLQQTSWIVVAEYPLADILAPFQKDMRALRFVIVISTVAVLALVWLMMHYLMAPLGTITRHVEGFSEKEGDARYIETGYVDEIGTLAHAFNGMVHALDSEHAALLESEHNFKALAENANEGMLIVSISGISLYANPQAAAVTGYDVAVLREIPLQQLIHDEDAPLLQERHRRSSGGELVEPFFECRIIRQNGEVVPVEVTTARTVWQGQPAELLIIKDITLRRQTEQMLREKEDRLSYLAHHDSLTELPNRLLCNDRLRQAVSRARRAGQLAAVLFIDLDRFKNINDTLGHGSGDLLLKEVAQRLRYWVRESDTVARLGGDEFVIIVEQLDDSRYAAVVAQKLISVLAQPISLNGHELFVTVSIGITIFPTDSSDVDGLMKCADLAMYSAKESGRNTYQFYTPDMNSRTHEMLEIGAELRRALEHEQLLLHYQPQLNLSDGALVGMEALIRWQHPARGMIMPDTFIQLAEESGLIVPIGEWVLKTACRQAKEWQNQRTLPFRVAVNISPCQFRSGNLVAVVASALQQTGLEAQWLELEITEGMIMGNLEASLRIMEELTAMGVHLAIDDFGTGYSSLGHLKRFPITRLKIDKSFVREIASNPNDAAIASAVIALAHTMSLEVIAEGIETGEQLEVLRRLGCEQGQGYLFSRPQPPALLSSFLHVNVTN